MRLVCCALVLLASHASAQLRQREPAVLLGGGSTHDIVEQLIAAHYPAHYVVQKLKAGEKVDIDGSLDEPAWAGVPWLEDFLDLAGPRFQGSTSWQEASREYAARLTGRGNPTKVKARWDDDFLYIAAELHSKHVSATVTGHCDNLTSSVWAGTPVLPYFDDDFEVFIDASQDNYFYVEYEMNARNATYNVLWSLPQAGLGSVAPECGGGGSALRVCCNTTWNHGKGLCDRGVETESFSWTMDMYDKSKRPGSGMHTSARNNTESWTVELRFPILSSDEHGGLINLSPGTHYPGSNPEQLHPAHGQRFWWVTFANALHPSWWQELNATTTQQPDLIKDRCQSVITADRLRNGFTQFLVDANNAAPTCYYEAASQNLGGHQYMHNPDSFGYFQFEADGKQVCRNVQWLARFVLAQLYQAEVQYLTNATLGNGAYTPSLPQLLSPAVCTIANACNVTALALAASVVSVEISAQEGHRGNCVQYAVEGLQGSNWTGGPCFNASVAYTVQSKTNASKVAHVRGTINEARFLSFGANVGQRWNEADSEWQCLDDVAVVSDRSIHILYA